MTAVSVPTIEDGLLRELAARIRPMILVDGQLFYVDPRDPRHQSFHWDARVLEPAMGLVELRTIETLHTFGSPSQFKPSMAEVLAAIPEDLADRVVAFKTSYIGDTEGCSHHVGRTKLYGKAG